MATPRAAPYRARQHSYGIPLMIAPLSAPTARGPQASRRDEGALRYFSSHDLPDLCAEWREIPLQSPHAHLFDLPEWVLSAMRVSNREPSFSAIVSRQGHKLIGVLPIVHRPYFLGAIPTVVIRGFTSQLSPRYDLIHHHAHAKLAAQMSWEELRRLKGWRVVELPNIPEGGAADIIADCARRDGFRVETVSTLSTPLIDLSTESSTYLPSEARAYRARLETKLLQVRQLGDIQFRSYTSVDEPLRRLIALEENSRQKRAISPALRKAPAGGALYREIGLWAERYGGSRVFSLEINGDPIAMLLGITLRDTCYALRVAQDMRLAMYSPGQLVIMAALQELQRQGTRKCELVGPALPWKRVWTSATRDHHSHYIFRPDRRGRTPLASILQLTLRGRSAWRHLVG
jgi:CelD/BcsL family acetyltransferase involved in cellulose biosynthesis